MRISIRYFRNIDEADLSIEDGKINFIVGPCGSGKSSIIDAISEHPKPLDTTVGRGQEETNVFINGQEPDYQGTSKYCLDRQEALFSKDQTGEGYRVFVGDTSTLQDLEHSFDKEVAALQDMSTELRIFSDRVEKLTKQLGKPGASGKFTPRSKFGKAISAIGTASAEVRSTLDKGGTDLLEWRMKGSAFLATSDETCPYCGQELTAERASQLKELDGAAIKDIKPLFNSTNVLAELDISRPDLTAKENAAKFEGELLEVKKIKDEIDKVLAFGSMSRHVSAIDKVPDKVVVDDVVYKRFPELRPLIVGINEKAAKLKSLVGGMKGAFNGLVRSNTGELNNELKSLGIPYEFALDSADQGEQRAAYKLVHTNAPDRNTDMRDALSYGERNLVALLLFLHNDSNGVVLIDDPASSYDDFRRSQIYNFIRHQTGKTVLVVSHDHAFVRRAVLDGNSNIGSILFITPTRGRIECKPIDRSSFVNLDSEIKNRAATATTYEQKIVNARLYYDIHRYDEPAVWHYLSAVLHGTPPKEISKKLEADGVEEETVLNTISFDMNLTLQPANSSSLKLNPATVDDWSDFELLIYEREQLNKPEAKKSRTAEDKVRLEMLNDLVHMNDCMLFALNPYEYAVWSPKLQEIASSLREEAKKQTRRLQ